MNNKNEKGFTTMQPAMHAPGTPEHPAIDPATPVTKTERFGINLHRREPMLNLFWILAGAGICAYSYRLGIFGPSGPDSGFFPFIAGAVMVFAGVALSLAPGSRVEASLQFWPEHGSARRVALVLGGLIVMILLMRFAGFLTAAVLTMPLLLRTIEGRSWRFAIIVGLISAGVVFFLFDTLLGTLLPRGPFGF